MPDSILKTILDAVQSEIQALSLEGIDSANVQVVKVENDAEESLPGLPGILIAPAGKESIEPAGGTNTRDDVAYPVLVTMLADETDSQTTNFDRNLLWRESIRKQFVHQKLSGVPSVFDCRAVPREVVDAGRWRGRNLWAASLLLSLHSRETRG